MKKVKNDAGSQGRRTTELPNFWVSDDLLSVKHDSERRIHRILFTNKKSKGEINTKTSLFQKLWKRTEPDKKGSLNWFRSNSITLSISKYGKCQVFSDIDVKLLPHEFIRTMRYDFCLTDFEILQFAYFLHLKSVEISHNISDPYASLKDSKLLMKFDDIKRKLWGFVDESKGTTEIELKGDPEHATNLEFLIRDKLKALLYFNSLTEILEDFAESIHRINFKQTVIENGVILLLHELFSTTELLTELINRTTELSKKLGDK